MDLEVNISHNMSEVKYSRKSLEKYFVFSSVIDYLVYLQSVGKLKDCSLNSMVDSIIKCSRNRYRNKDWIHRWILELVWMGVIKPIGDDRCALTDFGQDCYKKQVFHTIYSNLLNAKQSKAMSIVAVTISLISLIFAIIRQ